MWGWAWGQEEQEGKVKGHSANQRQRDQSPQDRSPCLESPMPPALFTGSAIVLGRLPEVTTAVNNQIPEVILHLRAYF